MGVEARSQWGYGERLVIHQRLFLLIAKAHPLCAGSGSLDNLLLIIINNINTHTSPPPSRPPLLAAAAATAPPPPPPPPPLYHHQHHPCRRGAPLYGRSPRSFQAMGQRSRSRRLPCAHCCARTQHPRSHAHKHAHTHTLCAHKHTHTHTVRTVALGPSAPGLCVCVCVCVCVCARVCVRVCVSVCVCAFMSFFTREKCV